jgi:NAD(P)-dependent dehydrogenase (short-subunit alcohol dehydrogenase family)
MTDTRDWLGLTDKLCVITGAGGGIGRAMAIAFAGAGARLTLIERNADTAAETANAVEAISGKRPLVLSCDVADETDVARAADASTKTQGPADVLVNNAAMMSGGGLDSVTYADWSRQLAVNLGGYFLCAKAFGAQMRPRKSGAILHIASISGHHPQAFSGAYSVGKAGIVMLSRQIAVEWGHDGVRSNTLSPGMIDTPLTVEMYSKPGVREIRNKVVPAGRIGQPSDIADAALFLASARASYVSGEDIIVDGGYTRMLMSLVPRPGFER